MPYGEAPHRIGNYKFDQWTEADFVDDQVAI